ncbi:hypothetical protein C4565_02405 [Candidatus Parcubacteria bacterium]|jgi:hypothetical protein|nr:MAG: hypothetical protein C4565_02405 [Candidatus Parcubacteria bacterium]
MVFSFSLSPEGIAFVKKHQNHLYPNVEYDENNSTITLDMGELKLRCTPGQFMSEIKRLGLLISPGISLNSDWITKYPYKLEPF